MTSAQPSGRCPVRPGWGVDPSVPDPEPRRCPSCGVAILPGRAQCHTCYLRAQAITQCATERAWMCRNFPEFRPRDLFPEDGWDEQEKQSTEKEVRGWRG